MSDLDLLHFEQLKNEVQTQYLENHTPSHDDISRWKGIDIIYFQEDLRKIAKGNISEKSFYTYFKNSPVTKLPRIDMLNILSVYAGYVSWYDFKKNHLFADEILKEGDDLDENEVEELEKTAENSPVEEAKIPTSEISPKTEEKAFETTTVNSDLQISATDNQTIKQSNGNLSTYDTSEQKSTFSIVKKYLWLGISGVLAVIVGLLGFKDELFSKKFYYSFIDADRNSKINAELQVQILKENESPILYVAKPNEPFVYTTKSKNLTMVVSSPYYRTDTIQRNLETAPEAENIELKPNDYAIMLFYYSKSIKDLKKKRESLNYLISDNALIYQVYDNETYGVETMDKQRYINLVTLPSTSLENLEVIETKNDLSGKINMIKFKITTNEKK
ncbi:MAG TPA: hypothetical protein PKC37_00670 [Kaistella sp.]|uniref:hypothetical protein n=1 Tax=Candidatus Kaistella beijingensis TaxID=2820270 RepID=UPI001CC375F0|nr:hypothetical protein [Candidatus Kaistella beijingensis]UBB88733.1 hypothetical protein J4771_07540 [Candidatus Kaistella beijingensis]HMU06390.1 hypothetical protein [Kaistella sp.]HQD44404.1 hypothetical protein [Kaistella sp.]